MENGERPPWWRHRLGLGSGRGAPPGGEGPPRPSRRALAADAAVAVVLTVVALAVASRHPAIGPVADHPDVLDYLQLRPASPATPDSAPLPDPPIGHPPAADVPFPPPDPVPSGPRPYDPPEVLVALTALPLAARRRFPLVTFWAVMAAALATHQGATWITVLTCAVAAYGAAAHGRNRFLAVGGLVLAAGLAGGAFRDVAPALPDWMGPFVVLLGVGAAGSFAHVWRRQLGASRSRFAELEQAQADAMRRAVAEERSRIAAELHDVVTHNVSVMVIQAGAARKIMDEEPEQSKQALLAIESGGRAAMSELRNVMGLLAGPGGDRLDGPADGLAPQPGLDQLGELVERVRAAGVPVRVTGSPPVPLPPGVDLAAYRVVQEALTNTIKHAAGSAASVTIGHEGDWLEIEVSDTGGGRTAGPRAGGGRGLIGLRERLAVYGGTLHAGRTAGGGFLIKARVPWRTP
ncbi:sensor histidine kinase [Nonomuraea soli]|uniref:histidine kinase n=1 Tax=Nonomuraea soli TaxID=1032476 RepID=A0A7W0CER1_9ACTN|nr:histidine kinase [Nonomuraea soli]MBA2889803.1 signal transduction histidine kinase [Nonomuraea soli]